MANTINEALQNQERTGVEALRNTGRIGYRAVNVQAAPVAPSALSSLAQFAQQGVRAYAGYRQAQVKRADARSDEILSKLTPQQRRDARANGTLLYQDDSDTMAALARKVGRNGAYDLDLELQQKINEGKFKTQEDLQTYAVQRRIDASKTYAEANGIDPQDKDFNLGFNSDISHRNNALADTMAQHLSKQYQASMVMQGTTELNSLLEDPSILQSEHGPQQVADYLNHQLETGGIGDEQMAVSILQRSLQGAAGRPGAAAFVKGLRDKTVNLYGKPVKVSDALGADQMDEFESRAAHATFTHNHDLSTKFGVALQNAGANPDTAAGIATLNQLEIQRQKIQGTDMQTPEAQQILQMRATILSNQKAQQGQRQSQQVKLQQHSNKMAALQARFDQRFNGESASTDISTMPSDENTGTWSEQDSVNFAVQKLAQIDGNSQLSDEQKNTEKLKYLRNDSSNGGFRKFFQQLGDDAQRQYQGLVVSPSTQISDATTDKINQGMAVYKADPATMAAVYPEQAAFYERLMNLQSSGLGLDVAVEDDRTARAATKEQQQLADQKWNDLKTGSDSSVPFVPAPLDAAARTLFNAEMYRTGDEGRAKAVVNDFLGKTTTTFGSDTKTLGTVTKRALMLDPQDPTSWQAGRELLSQHMDALAAEHPHMNKEDLEVVETPRGIFITDPWHTINMTQPITTQMLQQEAADQTRKASADKIDLYRQEAGRREMDPFYNKKRPAGPLIGGGDFGLN
ncbi:hypothetical protein [Pseudomonas sp. B14(2017)]|uniref:hypothetical protein n=1 Tax=Pseudomonas sp. B14(2017) TaxID=1981745 RepID=UPI000A1E9902|nr:hypothetical protein [Pseudomonas sp. B14(2017)]